MAENSLPIQGRAQPRQPGEATSTSGSALDTTTRMYETASAAWDDLVKRHLAPALRREGFRGSGRSFVMETPDCWALIGFQRSQFGDQEEVLFTLNFQVIGKTAYQRLKAETPTLRAIPPASTYLGPEAWRRRPGTFIGEGQLDHWWTVRRSTNIQELGAEIVRLVGERAIPAMRVQMECLVKEAHQ